MITGYPKGSDLTLMDARYRFPRKDPITEKWDKGSITLIAKDNSNGKKVSEVIDNPMFEFYMVKEDIGVEHNLFFIEQEKVDMIEVPFVNLEKKIAELTGNLDFYYDNIKTGNRYTNKQLHTHNRILRSDMHIEDYYRMKFSQFYQNNICEINRTYLDIEADTIEMNGDFPELGECPINAVTLVNEKTNKVYTLLLRNSENPLIKEFEDSIVNEDILSELRDFITKAVGGQEKLVKYGLANMEYEILFYDDEIQLIQDTFIIINTIKPDFVLAWNMAFDIPYIIERCKVLGYDPALILAHPDFELKQAKYYIDEFNKMDPAERGDYATITSYTVYIDQLIQFASRRKGQAKFNSFKLNDIGMVVAKVKKLDYKHITTDIAKLPWLDYKIFVFYNIMDTIVQKCIESNTGDIDYVFGKCIVNSTRYNKVHRQSIYLGNRASNEFLSDGFVMGNNVNKGNKKEEKFAGAFVADPKKVSNYARVKINGIPINIYDNADDYDYARLYPSMLQESNMAPNTQVGKLYIPNKVHDLENRSHDDHYSRGGNFLEDLSSGCYLEFCKRWFGMDGYEELYDNVTTYFTTIANPRGMLLKYTLDGLVNPIRTYVPDALIHPIRLHTGLINPITIHKGNLNTDTIGALRNVYNTIK